MNLIESGKLLVSGTVFVVVGIFVVSPILSILVQLFLLKVFYERLKKVDRVKWAPLRVPLQRRLQTLCIFLFTLYIYYGTTICIALNFVLLYHINNLCRILVIITWIWTYYYHYANLYTSNGNGWMKLRKIFFGQWTRAYFPVELVKTAELKPDRNYLIASFPHGIISFGPLVNMSLDISEWLKTFPGIRPKVATLDINFCVPLIDMCNRGFGLVSISKASLLSVLCKSNDLNHADNKDGFTSNAISVAVGGAKEASQYQRGQYNILLKDRKGFVKIAIISGASIVPSITFNEVEGYEQVVAEEGSILYYFQYYVKKLFGIWPSMIIGRGLFQYSIGIIPQRRRLVQVVGAPIDVTQCDVPDPSYVNEMHKIFVKALTDLFEEHKTDYLYTKDAKLIIT